MQQRERLIQRRLELNMNHEQVAELAKITRAYYSNIEAGRKTPSMRVAKRIADALQTTVDQIFFEGDVPKRNTA
ncbi:hypothetical protein DNHGIG_31330 [Collibacillus ludicampi]|jgi:DNA-binding XRE family transcriptional regulator|uniref:HTH cro/C1-type domain-containing protein n=1 Tax=Collibacillus ludicampi TaxID=2771369 RepID=A0AAV4LIJ3_9BACL|nr:helix-turn-helix transcriptional regulator [Collibacillus ludicampi]GIM47584.1 hypothetical protein DNHGIG_31330 [Collibacillus ludicampi]